eukprot:TRINITY_DN20120_c0_g2_i1.p1 TRINITY_DN20120_c0_g2~~TRINITY_DN20120_c0_g2_i1.p1  ORF type:complete len:103 (-),score=5.92 TRINITY_DN20120_c0_g2_i1:377-685(-)
MDLLKRSPPSFQWNDLCSWLLKDHGRNSSQDAITWAIFVSAVYTIWNSRNNMISRQIKPDVQRSTQLPAFELKMHLSSIKRLKNAPQNRKWSNLMNISPTII